MGRSVGPGPTRFCPACYARNRWAVTRCDTCGAPLAATDDFDERLVWALRHPDTATAIRAAQAIAARGLTDAIGALRATLQHNEAYRAAAAAEALAAFSGRPEADAGIAEARRHSSVVVRRAVERALSRGSVSSTSEVP